MILLHQGQDAPAGAKIVAIGSFDGLHLGHQSLLSQARSEASTLGLALAVYTFDPPAQAYFRGESFLASLGEKARDLAEFGVAITVIRAFDQAFAEKDKSWFLQELAGMNPQKIYVGPDFSFGYRRGGTPEDLAALAPTEIVPMFQIGEQPVKSSLIRRLLNEGEVAGAADFLGRPYAATGVVVPGDRRGALLGFPTANLEVPPSKLLPRGVYRVNVRQQGQNYRGMANIGVRPTFSGTALRFEVHIFNFSGNLYGQVLRVEFLGKIRDEQKFSGPEELRAQLERDAAAAQQD